jgi:Domain of unknown function (DUF3943)
VPHRPSLGSALALFALASSIGIARARADEAAASDAPPNDTPPGAASSLHSAATPRLDIPVVHALGLMSAMRLSEAYLWPQPFAELSRGSLGLHYHEAFSLPPRWDGSRPLFQEDGDRWQLNVFGHGLFGSELYLRARTCRLPAWQALLFTGLASATWEYGVEANGVRPSALDLTFTPAAGLALGETRYQAWRATRRLDPGALRSTLSALLDPLGDLERALGSPC